MEELHWRILAGRLWGDDMARALRMDTRGLDPRERIAFERHRRTAREIYDHLFPKD